MLDFFGELAKLKLQSRDYTAKPKKKALFCLGYMVVLHPAIHWRCAQ
jgi:hypothetical protein